MWLADDSHGISRQSKGKDQESIQSSTIPGPEHHTVRLQNTRKYNTHESQEVGPIQAGDHKTARNRQYSLTKIRMKHK